MATTDSATLKPVHLLLIEDNRSDIYIFGEILRQHRIEATLTVIEDGDSAIHFFDEMEANPEISAPTLILLDLNLPKRSGHELLGHLKQGIRGKQIPVIVVTSSGSPKDLASIARLGATGYFQKSANLDAYMKLGDLLKKHLS